MKSFRLWWMWIGPAAMLVWYWHSDPNDGMQLLTQLQTMAGPAVALGLVYLSRKSFFPGDAKKAWDIAMGNPIGAGLALISVALLTGLLFLGFVPRAVAAPLPGNAARDLPILTEEIGARWESMPMPSMLGALVEQESGWKERATLKTAREEGAGYGQFTRAYRADGSLRFDALADVRALDPGLAGWRWEDRYNPRMQLRGVVVKNRGCFQRLRKLVDDDYNALAMCDAAYNSGEGSVYARRRLCAQMAGCDAGRWFGHAERYSTQSKAKWQGYGASAFEITNTHVRNVMIVRRPKYVAAMGA